MRWLIIVAAAAALAACTSSSSSPSTSPATTPTRTPTPTPSTASSAGSVSTDQAITGCAVLPPAVADTVLGRAPAERSIVDEYLDGTLALTGPVDSVGLACRYDAHGTKVDVSVETFANAADAHAVSSRITTDRTSQLAPGSSPGEGSVEGRFERWTYDVKVRADLSTDLSDAKLAADALALGRLIDRRIAGVAAHPGHALIGRGTDPCAILSAAVATRFFAADPTLPAGGASRMGTVSRDYTLREGRVEPFSCDRSSSVAQRTADLVLTYYPSSTAARHDFTIASRRHEGATVHGVGDAAVVQFAGPTIVDVLVLKQRCLARVSYIGSTTSDGTPASYAAQLTPGLRLLVPAVPGHV